MASLMRPEHGTAYIKRMVDEINEAHGTMLWLLTWDDFDAEQLEAFRELNRRYVEHGEDLRKRLDLAIEGSDLGRTARNHFREGLNWCLDQLRWMAMRIKQRGVA